MPRGKFIVIEGSDGSGKSTHFALLQEYFKAQNREIATYKFPQYDNPSSYFVTAYLNGKYGDANSLGAYTPSLFYALDRFEGSAAIRRDLEAGKIVLCDRYVGSNMAHQGQKITDKKERHAYYDWIHNLEFNMLKIPKPDLNVVLLMPASIAQELMNKREDRSYTDKKHDIHEADLNHLERAVATYTELCQLFSETFASVACTEQGNLQSIDEIQQQIRNIVEV
ncbi:MAG TPA: deoxynucleoside kinase [Candidatus Saccharimonadales bacterium]|nr:deoxynucleoside kinase [Candidatus Saccharimonadales bacterium]